MNADLTYLLETVSGGLDLVRNAKNHADFLKAIRLTSYAASSFTYEKLDGHKSCEDWERDLAEKMENLYSYLDDLAEVHDFSSFDRADFDKTVKDILQ